LLEFGAGESEHKVLGTGGVSRQVGQVDLSLLHGGKLNLGFLSGFFQALQRLAVVMNVNPAGLLEFLDEEIHHAQVKVITAQEGIAVGGTHLEDAFADIQHGYIESAAAEVINRDDLVLFLIQPVSQGGRGRFVDDAQHFKPGDTAGVFGGVALGVVEIRRHGNHGLVHSLTQVGFGVCLELAEDHGANLGGAVLFAVEGHADITIAGRGNFVRHAADGALYFRVAEFATHQALDRKNSIFGVDDGLVAGGAPHDALVILVYRHD